MQRTPVFSRFYTDYPWWDVQGNDSIILKAAAHPLTPKALAAAADRVQDDLVIEAEWKAGWHAFIAKYPRFAGSGTYPNMLLAFKALQLGALPTVENFEDIAERGMLAESREYIEQRMDGIERERLIAEISQGKDSYSWRDITGKKSTWLASDLNEESTGRLREIAVAIAEQRRLETDSPEEIRAAIKQVKAAQGVQESKDALINPATSQPFTRRELVQLIAKGDKKVLRGILFDFDGRIIQERQKAVDRILKGQQ